jgi:hypothetical protein
MSEKGRLHVKRLVSIAALAAAVAVTVVPAASPASGKDYTGPKCANITSGMGGYTGTAGSTGTVDFVVQYAAPVCSSITYTFAITDQTGALIANATADATCTPEVAGGGCLHFTATLQSAPSTVCVYSTTSHKNGNQTDYAPDFNDPTCAGPTPELSLAIGNASGAGIFR